MRDRGVPPAQSRRCGSLIPDFIDKAAALVVPRISKSLLERVQRGASEDLDDGVNVLGGPRRRGAGIGDPQNDGCAADEHDLVDQRPECLCKRAQAGRCSRGDRCAEALGEELTREAAS